MKRAAALACVALAACSATPPAAPPDPGKAETGPEASAAVEAATVCVQKMNGGVNDGYSLVIAQATARRDPSDGARWIVTFPPGHYLGRLPPPEPGQPLMIVVEPAKNSACTAVPAAPHDR